MQTNDAGACPVRQVVRPHFKATNAFLYYDDRGEPQLTFDCSIGQERLFSIDELNAAVAAERERCAKICDDYAATYPFEARNARANRRSARVLANEIRGA